MSLPRRLPALVAALLAALVLAVSASAASAAVTINSVTPNPVGAGSTITASTSITDSAGPAVAYLFLNGPGTTNLLIANFSVTTPGNVSLSGTIPSDRSAGSYTVRVMLVPQSGGQTLSSPDSSAFTVARLEPIFTSATGPTGTYDVSDTLSAQYTAVRAASASGSVAIACTLDAVNLPCSATTATIPAPQGFGNHTLKIVASNSGFTTTKTYTFTTAPLVTVASGPGSGDVVSGTPAWTFSASVGASFGCRVYPATATVLPDYGSCSSTMSSTAPGLQPGDYAFQVRATSAGYVGPPTTRTFTVAADLPIAAPTVAPAGTIDFGTVARSTISEARSITVTNASATTALRVSRVRLGGADGDDFIVAGDTCIGEAVASGESCTIRVRFAPSAAGVATAALNVTANTAALTTVPLVGTGGSLPSGPQGIPGAIGATGPAGVTGAAGLAGAPGSDGASGAVGATGPAGANGAVGLSGPAGAVGASGATGPAGAPGRDAVVTCVAKRPARGRVPVTCTVKLASAPKKATAARLTQSGKRVAVQPVSKRTSRLRFLLPRGKYVLSIAGTTVTFRA